MHDSNSIREQANSIPEQAHNALLRKMDGGGDAGDFDIGDLWSDGEGDEVGPRPTHDGGMDTMSMEQLGLKAQDVPADGNCLLHAFAQAQRQTSHAAQALCLSLPLSASLY